MSRAGYLISKLMNKVLHRSSMVSYAQCGEDLIINHLFNMLGIRYPSYLDIGAHHPTYFSNTYFFYKKGCHGVCVEPDPSLFRIIKRKRKRDTCLNVGVGSESNSGAEMDFFIMTAPTLNTFSQKEAQRYQSYGKQKIEKVISIPLISVNTILNDHFPAAPNFVSLDVEGLDLQIAESIDFERFRPEVFCIETLSYTEDRTEVKLNTIIELMDRRQYVVYADTYINTIFVESRAWRSAHRWESPPT
jgi:FkbM family methyltransferase